MLQLHILLHNPNLVDGPPPSTRGIGRAPPTSLPPHLASRRRPPPASHNIMFAVKPPSPSPRHGAGFARTPPTHVLLFVMGVAVCAFVGAFHGAGSGAARALVHMGSAAAHVAAASPARATAAPPSTGCTPAQRDTQADAFVKATAPTDGSTRPTYRGSACPSISILAALQAADPAASAAGGGLTLVNVGANKGYGVAEVASLWRPDLGVTPASVYEDLKATYPNAAPAKIRGACGDGDETVPEPAVAPDLPALVVHAVEPLPTNLPLLRRLARSIADARAPSAPGARMFVHPGAVGPDLDAQLGFDPAKCLQVGLESCQMAPLRAGLTPVTGWTLDSFFEEHALQLAGADRHGVAPPRSIFLKIDAEGYDGAIIMNSTTGPGSALDAVRAMEFEYHRVGKWGAKPDQVRLEQVVDKLDGAGLDCYLQHRDTLVHLTGSCWTGAYEFFMWSNVLCVRRDDVWADAAAGLAVWKS
jgi:hypothetical protein